MSSSAIASVGYDKGNDVLEVEFVGGHVYRYYGVPEAVYVALMASPSLGSYLNHHIRDQYRFARV